MFYFNKYQKYFLLIRKNKVQNFKLHVGKFWRNFFIVKNAPVGLINLLVT